MRREYVVGKNMYSNIRNYKKYIFTLGIILTIIVFAGCANMFAAKAEENLLKGRAFLAYKSLDYFDPSIPLFEHSFLLLNTNDMYSFSRIVSINGKRVRDTEGDINDYKNGVIDKGIVVFTPGTHTIRIFYEGMGSFDNKAPSGYAEIQFTFEAGKYYIILGGNRSGNTVVYSIGDMANLKGILYGNRFIEIDKVILGMNASINNYLSK